MLGEELPEQALMRATGRVVERGAAPSGEKLAQRGARLGGQHSTRWREPRAASTQRAAGRMAEHHRGALGQRCVALGAHVDGGAEAKLGDDVPGARERHAQRMLVRRGCERVERGGYRIEETGIGGVAAESQRELGDRRGTGETTEITRELGARQRDVEAAERVEVAAGLA
jgi:hypothetical protein